MNVDFSFFVTFMGGIFVVSLYNGHKVFYNKYEMGSTMSSVNFFFFLFIFCYFEHKERKKSKKNSESGN